MTKKTEERSPNFQVQPVMAGWGELQPVGDEPFFLIGAGVSPLTDLKTYQRKNYDRTTFEYVEAGKGYLEIDHVTYALKAGDVYLLPLGHSHKYYPTCNAWSKRFFICTGPLTEKLLDVYGLTGRYHFSNCGKDGIHETFMRIHDLFQAGESDLHLEGACLLHELIQKLYIHEEGGITGKTVSTARRIRHVLDRNIYHKMDIRELARYFHMSGWNLTKTFKAEFGITPYEYHLQRRLELAKEMLRSGNQPVGEIAHALNFYDPFHFSKMFRKKIGLSPTEYQQRAARANEE